MRASVLSFLPRTLMSASLGGLLGLSGAMAADNPPGVPPDATKAGDNYVYTCNNLHYTCYPPDPCSTNEYWRCSQDSSIVNHAALWHTHFATDYAVKGLGSSSEGCAPCGATSAPTVGELPGLTFGRIHNYAFTGQRSSFGPGVYSSYDISLELSTLGYSWSNYGKRTIRVVDPASGPFVESTYDHDWTQADFTGTPVLSRVDATVDFDWGTGSPGTGVPNAVRFTRAPSCVRTAASIRGEMSALAVVYRHAVVLR